MEFTIKSELPAGLRRDARTIGGTWVERMLASTLGVGSARRRALSLLQASQRAEGNKPRLSPAELAAMIEFQVLAEDVEYRRTYFRDTPIDKTLPGQLIPIVDHIIDTDDSVRSFMNIGVRYAHVDHLLAKKHPNKTFYGVDFMPNLAEMNANLALPNLHFVSGYAMDLIEMSMIAADVVMFSATAITIRNAELNTYLTAIKKFCRYVVMNEILYPLPDGKFIDPATLPLDESVATFEQPVPWPGKKGPLCKTHNFHGMLRAAGYSVIHYHVFRPAWTEQFVVQTVGKYNL